MAYILHMKTKLHTHKHCRLETVTKQQQTRIFLGRCAYPETNKLCLVQIPTTNKIQITFIILFDLFFHLSHEIKNKLQRCAQNSGVFVSFFCRKKCRFNDFQWIKLRAAILTVLANYKDTITLTKLSTSAPAFCMCLIRSVRLEMSVRTHCTNSNIGW